MEPQYVEPRKTAQEKTEIITELNGKNKNEHQLLETQG